MAWDTDRTRRLLREAATAEFSEHGPAGARIDRIAARAGVNKERIYSYFGGKEALFDAVIASELGAVTADVPLVGEGPAAIGDYAAALLERIARHPEIGRLMAWEGLVRGDRITALEMRWEHCRSKVADLQRALPGLSDADAGQLLLTIVTLTDGWAVFPQLGRLFAAEGSNPLAARAEALRRTATLIAADACERARHRSGAGRVDGADADGVRPPA